MIAILSIKYKPTYSVSLSGKDLGNIDSINSFEESVKQLAIENNENANNIDSITIKEEPKFELKLVAREEQSNDEEILDDIKQNVDITYKYYEIALSNVVVDSVNTKEEAVELVNTIEDEELKENLDISIIEKYTNNEEEIKTNTVELAKQNVEGKVVEQVIAEEAAKIEAERIAAMPVINGIKLAYTPVLGTLTSRYAEVSSIRSSSHTGLDISCSTGTDIKVVSDGTVISASYEGSYGNLVKVDHGNGLQTWYAHTNKMYVKAGQTVSAGDIIAAVGSTGNSTGPHLHLEIRVNGSPVNPQKYLYN